LGPEMKIRNALMIASSAFAFGGCATYPLSQDTSGATTDEIVANVRCQARRAVRRAFRNAMETFGSHPVALIVQSGRKSTYTGTDIIRKIDDGTLDYRDLRVDQFVGIAKYPMNYYATTQVAYEFTLDATEKNTQGVGIDLVRDFLRRADKIGINVSTDLTREISRTFTVQDSFLNLAAGISSSYCRDEFKPNIIYPLTGNMPVTDLVDSYIKINQFNILSKTKYSAEDYAKNYEPHLGGSFQGTEGGPSTPQMADTITFTTKLISKSEPSIQYNPLGPGFSVAGLGFVNNNSREDKHKLIVTITTSEVDKDKNALGRGRDFIINPTPDDRRFDAQQAVIAKREKDFQDSVNEINRSLRSISGF
jgi:hypothetical protein